MNETFSILLGFFIMAAIIVGAVLYPRESLVANGQGIAAQCEKSPAESRQNYYYMLE